MVRRGLGCRTEAQARALRRTDPVRIARYLHDAIDTFNWKMDAERACQAGCAACCYQVPTLRPGEVDILVEAIQRLPAEAQTSIRAALSLAAAEVRKAGGPIAAFPLRCPLLGPDNLCQVYEARPAACRSMASKSRAACDALSNDTPIPLPLSAVATMQLRLHFDEIFATEKETRRTKAMRRAARCLEAMPPGPELAAKLEESEREFDVLDTSLPVALEAATAAAATPGGVVAPADAGEGADAPPGGHGDLISTNRSTDYV
jgi:Fe-S-cluster containining protein